MNLKQLFCISAFIISLSTGAEGHVIETTNTPVAYRYGLIKLESDPLIKVLRNGHIQTISIFSSSSDGFPVQLSPRHDHKNWLVLGTMMMTGQIVNLGETVEDIELPATVTAELTHEQFRAMPFETDVAPINLAAKVKIAKGSTVSYLQSLSEPRNLDNMSRTDHVIFFSDSANFAVDIVK